MSAAARKSKSGTAREAPVQSPPTGDDRVLLFADSLSKEAKQREEEHRWEPWLTVRVGDESLGLPVAQVQEVLRVGAITRVPHAPFPVCGVTSLRGAVLAVVDLRLRHP